MPSPQSFSSAMSRLPRVPPARVPSDHVPSCVCNPAADRVQGVGGRRDGRRPDMGGLRKVIAHRLGTSLRAGIALVDGRGYGGGEVTGTAVIGFSNVRGSGGCRFGSGSVLHGFPRCDRGTVPARRSLDTSLGRTSWISI